MTSRGNRRHVAHFINRVHVGERSFSILAIAFVSIQLIAIIIIIIELSQMLQ